MTIPVLSTTGNNHSWIDRLITTGIELQPANWHVECAIQCLHGCMLAFRILVVISHINIPCSSPAYINLWCPYINQFNILPKYHYFTIFLLVLGILFRQCILIIKRCMGFKKYSYLWLWKNLIDFEALDNHIILVCKIIDIYG